MLDLAPIAGKLAGIISLTAYAPYIISTLRKETKPNRASWFIWLTVSLIIALSYRDAGASYAFLVPVGYTIGSTIIAILSLKYGVGGWTRFDRNCLFGAGISLVLWRIFNSPMTALLINLFINLLGTLPTIRKAYYQPETENKVTWSMFSLGTIVNLFAIEKWVFSMAVYPVSMVFIVGIVTVLTLRINKWSYEGLIMNIRKCPYYAGVVQDGAILCRYYNNILETPKKDLETTNELSPRDWIVKGRTLYYSGNYQEAIDVFTRAIDLDQSSASAYFNLAATHHKLENKKQTIKNLRVAAKLDHKNAQKLLKLR